ncbi:MULTISPECIES: hypothetical protein [unclassified Streptomyces]|uniref:hypothetical protein n=1 Tax=unclassified Streptomyces TaxID=2593676 RepID=UPI00332275B2
MPEPRRLEKPLESFVQELALCVATNGDKGPALLWPEDFDTLPELLRIARPSYPRKGWPYAAENGPPPPDEPQERPAAPGSRAELLASSLGELLGLRVRPAFRFMRSLSVGGRRTSDGTECTVTVLEGACRCTLTRGEGAPDSGPRGTVDLRLRAGGTLFVPRDHVYSLLDVHTPTVLLELVLGEAD